jgi:uncharacterized protein (DUF608 family)
MRTREDNIVTTIDGSTCSCLYKEVDIIEQIIAYYYRAFFMKEDMRMLKHSWVRVEKITATCLRC